MQTGADLAVGGAKGGLKTLFGASEVGRRLLDPFGIAPGTRPGTQETALKQRLTTPTNTAQQIGQFGEQTAELAVPITKLPAPAER